MKTKTGILFLSIFGFLITNLAIANAETLFVRHGLSTGKNDGSSYKDAFHGPGSVKWGEGIGKVGAGDKLYMCGGPYDDALDVGASGTPGNEIIIDGNCSFISPKKEKKYETGILGRRKPETLSNENSAQAAYIIGLHNTSYITIQNLKLLSAFGVKRKKSFWFIGNGQQSHTAVEPSSTMMTCKNAKWGNTGVDDLKGGVIKNKRTNAFGIIEANTKTTITAKMQGGNPDNQWRKGDKFIIFEDTGQVKISGNSHHLTFKYNTIDNAGNPEKLKYSGLPFYIYVKDADIHHLTWKYNRFLGGGDISIAGRYAWNEQKAQLHDINISYNIALNQHQLIYIHGAAFQDPDNDGSNSNDNCSYGFEIAYNLVEIKDGGMNFFSISTGMKEVKGDGYNWIHNNRIKCKGFQIERTNIMQTHFAKDLIIEDNYIDGPRLKKGCDGCGIIVDWAWGSPAGVKERHISDGVIIRRNVVKNVSSECIGKAISVFRGKNVTVEDNKIFNSDIGIKLSGQDVDGFRATGIVVRNNQIYNSKVAAISVNKLVVKPEIHGNLIVGSESESIKTFGNNYVSEQARNNFIFKNTESNCFGDLIEQCF